MEELVYIGYAKRDANFANKLSRDLMVYGVKVWVDWADIGPGVSWKEALNDAIEDASVVLIVVSKSTLLSRSVLNSFENARRLEKKILAVVVEDIARPKFVEDVDEVDFTAGYEEGFKALLEALDISTDEPLIAAEELESEGTGEKSRGYVFISYAEEDTGFVEELKEYFAKRGYAYWDYQESDRDYTVQLSLELEEAIINASATLSVLSPDWKASVWAMREYVFSEEVNVPIFLVQARAMEPTLLIAGRTRIEFDTDKDQGFAALESALESKGL